MSRTIINFLVSLPFSVLFLSVAGANQVCEQLGSPEFWRNGGGRFAIVQYRCGAPGQVGREGEAYCRETAWERSGVGGCINDNSLQASTFMNDHFAGRTYQEAEQTYEAHYGQDSWPEPNCNCTQAPTPHSTPTGLPSPHSNSPVPPSEVQQ